MFHFLIYADMQNSVENEWPKHRGDSSVLFAYWFLLLFGQIDNICKVKQDSLYFFFSRGDSRSLKEKCLFRDMIF